MEETLDNISPILPIDFFSAQIDLQGLEKGALKKKCLLPDFSDLLFEDRFAEVLMGWDQRGLAFDVQVNKPFTESFYPNVQKGDSVELFIDTRDLKTAGFVTRFCHHFAILPKAMDGVIAQEITSFRTDDRHELCDASAILVESDFHKRSFSLRIFIPAECLHGYDPSSFERLGFTYRINRFEGEPQHFVVSSDYFNIENQPSLWSSMALKKS